MLARTTFSAPETLRKMVSLTKHLDSTNVTILSAMRSLGPRKLLRIARATGLPFSTVYNRVNKLRTRVGLLARVVPSYSRLGLVRVELLAQSMPGNEALLKRAVKLPNWWSVMCSSEGFYTHFSVHAVPKEHLASFRKYLDRLKELGLVQRYALIRTTDDEPIFPVFEAFDPETRTWTFDWKSWLTLVRTGRIVKRILDPPSWKNLADRTDILLLKELEIDGAKKYVELSKVMGKTLQAAKWRYERSLLRKGLIKSHVLELLPYPVGISDLREIRIDFSNTAAMNRFYSNCSRLVFAWGLSKVIGQNSLLVRTYTPRAENGNLFGFLSALVRSEAATNYSAIRLNFEEMERQTLSYELFDEERGWVFDSKRVMSSLEQLVAPRARS